MDTTALSYNDIMEQIKQVPQECLPEISNYIGYVIYVNSRKDTVKTNKPKKSGLSKYFGTLHLGDGMEIQKAMRDEWD